MDPEHPRNAARPLDNNPQKAWTPDELLAIAWTIISGAAIALYGAVWIMLAVRAAASLHPLQMAVTLAAAAEASFMSALLYMTFRSLFER